MRAIRACKLAAHACMCLPIDCDRPWNDANPTEHDVYSTCVTRDRNRLLLYTLPNQSHGTEYHSLELARLLLYHTIVIDLDGSSLISDLVCFTFYRIDWARDWLLDLQQSIVG
jgi:hypothetical protein